MYTNFVTLSEDDIPDNFIKFNSLDIRIDHQQMNPDKPLYFTVDPSQTHGSHTFSDVCIDQENEDGEMKHIARFYNRYGYTVALRLLLDDETNLEFYRLMIKGTNIPNDQIDVKLTFYLEKMFLLNLYERVEVPLIIYKLLTKDDEVKMWRKKKSKEVKKTAPKLDLCQPFPTNNANDQFKREPYRYQRQNYCWMAELERQVDQGTLCYETFTKPQDDNINYYYIESIGEYLLLDKHEKRMIDINTFPTKSFRFNGGVLADDVGLGKTFSTIGLIQKRKVDGENPTLIICPRRLCLQWKGEIEMSTDLKCFIVNSITQFKKLNLVNINSYDIVLIAYQFLTNAKYHQLCDINDANLNYPLFHTYPWRRLILDEGHEYITSSQNLNKKHYRETLQELYRINSKYRWICSGTPYTCELDIFELVKFLGPRPLNHVVSYHTRYSIIEFNEELQKQYTHILKDVIDLLCRKNTKESVTDEVTIPEPNIQTTLLNMTSIERAIYNSALDDQDKKIQLCNNILVSEHHIKVLGNDPISQTEAHEKMGAYYEKKISYQNKRLENLKTEINQLKQLMEQLEEQEYQDMVEYTTNENKLEELETKFGEINTELKENLRKQKIFAELSENLEKEKCCPVCYEDLDGLFKAVTPCGHFICGECIQEISKCSHKLDCPMCRTPLQKESLNIISPENMDLTMKLGTKMSELIKYSKDILEASVDNRMIIFSQWDSMLRLISKNLNTHEVNHMILNGSYHTLNSKLRKFRLDTSIRIVLLSSEKAASGLNLTEANHIVLMDTLNNDPETSKVIENQAIGRSVRIGQTQQVQVKRFIMANTIEEEFYHRFL